MRIGSHTASKRLRALILAPDLRVSQEETLFQSVAVELILVDAVVFKPAQQCHIGEADSGIVGAVFSKRQPSVYIHAFHRAEFRILVDQAIRPALEGFIVLLRPPIAQVAIRIELPALVVKVSVHD